LPPAGAGLSSSRVPGLENSGAGAPTPRPKYVRAVGPRLRLLLVAVLGLFAVLGANSVYLAGITFMEWLDRDKGVTYQNYFYQYMFLAHLALGFLIIIPFLVFGYIHWRNTHHRPTRKTVQVGYVLMLLGVVVLATGIALVRFKGLDIRNPAVRSTLYWAHFVAPLACIWLYVLHRMSGPRIKWRVGVGWAAAMVVAMAGMVALHKQDPRRWRVSAPKEGDKYFEPSEARTATGNFIPPEKLLGNEYCLECHADGYKTWQHSAHHFSSFNNPFYMYTIVETRKAVLGRDGDVKASRWCAGCHDPVPFFSGAFDDPNFDFRKDPTAMAGLSCVACHSIVEVKSTRGNGDYIIEEPPHYPWTFAPTNSIRFWLNKQLVKAKPAFHKQTFLKPVHKTAEFCSACHKVGIPWKVNHYKEFLRGQNHYDSYLLTGVSGHSARSFYYPEKAKQNCSVCHMPLMVSDDFGAAHREGAEGLTVHDHLFPGANTALQQVNKAADAMKQELALMTNCARVDIFGVREDGDVNGRLVAPLRPAAPKLVPGKTYLLDVVVRNLTVGHPITQGTVDSNEVWVDAAATDVATGVVVGRSGGKGPHGEVDPWSHFVNVYMLDKDGNRIDRRNAQDIFTPLYNNQIPPSGSSVVHYKITVPPGVKGPLRIDAAVRYRKFDTIYLNYMARPDYASGVALTVTNDLPVATLGADTLVLEIEAGAAAPAGQVSKIPEWQRWNDYGVGLFNKGDRGIEKGELRQAAEAFATVEALGRADGPLNLARVLFKEGRLEDAVLALGRANDTNRFQPAAPRWTVAWLNGLVDKQNGRIDEAIKDFRSVLEDRYPELDRRGFDFSKDYEVINELGQAYYERAKMERSNPDRRREFLRLAAGRYEATLQIDSENLAAHYNLGLLYAELGDAAKAEAHRRLHDKYRPDDNARDHAVAAARLRDKAADHAAQNIVIYDLQRPGAFELPAASAQPGLAAAPGVVGSKSGTR
jgi:tetratricopeptide (TPR) repeat protein